MELINKQDAIKALKDTFLGDTYEIDAVACGTIEDLKTVDVIPVEWLRKKQDEHANDGFEWIFEEIINEWKQEKQNVGKDT